MNTFRTEGSGAQQTLHEIEDEKIPIYDTKADAEADLANLAEGQIVATKDTSNDYESELYNYVDAKLATTEVDVPITGASLTCKARKSGNTVTVEFITIGSDLVVPHSDTTTIGTLPEGYRPVRLEEFTIGARVVSSTDDVATYPPRVSFDTNGAIKIRDWNPTADVTLNSPYNVFTFLVDGTNSSFMSVNTLKDAKDYTDEKIYEKIAGTIRVTDCDTMDVPGTYNYDPNTANTPDNFYGVLVVYGSSPDKTPSTNRRWIFQIATNTRGEVFRRQKNNPQSGGTWSAWTTDVINKNLVAPNPSTNQSNVYSALIYQLQNVDWAFLTYHPAGTTATGNFELAGYYWGNYVATKNFSNNITVTGTIDWFTEPHAFSAFYDATAPGWKVSIGGWRFVSFINNILVLKSTNGANTYKVIADNAQYDHFLTTLQNNGLLVRPANGTYGQTNLIDIPGNNRYLIDNTASTPNWPANTLWWFNGTSIFHLPDTQAATWWFEHSDSQTVSRYNLWGIGWDQSKCWANLTFEA